MTAANTPTVTYRPVRALVTGGTGFIGSNLVRILLDEGVAVRVLAMPGDLGQNLAAVRDRVELVTGDLLDEASHRRALEGCDTLFHLAAIYAIWLPEPRKMYDVNVEGTRRLMRAALAAGVRRVVHTSSIAAIGARPDGAPADEDCHFNDWSEASDYVLSKYISELEVLRMCGEGLPAVVVNPAFPFGAFDLGPTPTGQMIQHLMRGFPLSFPGAFNAVGVEDVARGHWLAACRGAVGRRYLLGGENLTYGDFARRVAAVAGVKPPRWVVPRSAAIGLGALGDFVADHVTHKPPMIAQATTRFTIGRDLCFDISRARRELGYDPAPIEGPIRAAVDWFRSGRAAVRRAGR